MTAPTPPPELTVRRRLLAATLATLLGCAVVLTARYVHQARVYRALDLQIEGDLTIEEDPEIGFVPAKNGVTVRRQPSTRLEYHLYTDDRRARVSRPHVIAPPRVDLLTVGCSFSWGHGIENEATYTQSLGQRFHVAAANFSLGSYSTVQSLLMLRRNLDLRPRVVLYGFIAEHLRRNLSPCAPNYGPLCLPGAYVVFDSAGQPSIHPPGPGFAENRTFYQTFLSRRTSIPREVWALAKIDLLRRLRPPRPASATTPENQERALSFLLAGMHDAARSIGAKLIVVGIPSLEETTGAGLPPELAQAMAGIAGDDVLCLDVTPAIEAYNAAQWQPPLYLGDGHPSAAGHALFAEEIERVLRQRRWL